MTATQHYQPRPQLKPLPDTSIEARALNVIGRKWALLIVKALLDAGEPMRFVALQRSETLQGISVEQLRTRLNDLVAAGILTRTRYREVPPRVDYDLTPVGLQLAPVLDAIAQWGHDWAPPAS